MTGLEFLDGGSDSSRPASGMIMARVARYLRRTIKVRAILALCGHYSATNEDQAKLLLEAKSSQDLTKYTAYEGDKACHDSQQVENSNNPIGRTRETGRNRAN